jgi:hypothetical protein
MFVEGGLHPEQVKALRRMSLQRRLDLSLGAIEQMRAIREAMLARSIQNGQKSRSTQLCAISFAMAGLNPLAIFAPGLNRTNALWMAVGSIASSAYGEPRTTLDVDVVIVIGPHGAALS